MALTGQPVWQVPHFMHFDFGAARDFPQEPQNLFDAEFLKPHSGHNML
jgi:hypothetical protein